MIGNYSVDLSPVAQGLNMRAARIEEERKRQEEMEVKKLIGQSITTLREGAPLRKLFEADPQAGAFIAKALNVPLDNLSELEQFSQNVRTIASIGANDPEGAVSIAAKLRDDRAQMGLDTTQYDKFLQTYQDNPQVAMRALQVMDESLNSDLIEAQQLAQRKQQLEERRMLNEEQKTAIQRDMLEREMQNPSKQYASQLVDDANMGLLVFDPATEQFKQASIDGKPITRASFDPMLKQELSKAGALGTGTGKDIVDYKKSLFDSINSNSRMLNKYNFAIKQLDEGAQTGPVIRSLPNLKEQSVLVDVVRKEIGMEILGSGLLGVNPTDRDVDFALTTAIPDNLMPDALKRELQRRSSILQDINAAQEEYYRLIEEEGMTKGDILKLAKQRREQQKQQDQGNEPSIDDLLSKY